MKKIIILLVLISTTFFTEAQLLIKNSRTDIQYQPNPEQMISIVINSNLKKRFNVQAVPKCYAKIFYVKFELNEKGKTNDFKASTFMTDTVIINIVQQALKTTEEQWDIEKCKKHNPSLKFLLPIYLAIKKEGCNITFTSYDTYHYKDSEGNNAPIISDFRSMLNYDPETFKDGLRDPPYIVDEKFVGMVLDPIYIHNF